MNRSQVAASAKKHKTLIIVLLTLVGLQLARIVMRLPLQMYEVSCVRKEAAELIPKWEAILKERQQQKKQWLEKRPYSSDFEIDEDIIAGENHLAEANIILDNLGR